MTPAPKHCIILTMGILTSQKISDYYERFKAIDVTFSREIIQVTGLIPNQVYLKCVGDFWPCVIFSSSFQGAKIVANIKSGILQKLERANNMVSLRFCFKNADTGNPVSFFINTKSTGYSPYGGSKDVALFALQFAQRPPDDLIEIMGRILDANVNSAKRREERITITPDSSRKLNMASKESAVFIQKVPRHCILRDISFSGAKIIMMGVAKFLVEKPAALRIDFEDPRESFLLQGKFIRAEAVEGRKELVALVILFNENTVPMGFKIRLNDYLSQVRAEDRGSERAPGASAKKTGLAEGPALAAAPQPSAAMQPSAAPQPPVVAPQASAASQPAPAKAPEKASEDPKSPPQADPKTQAAAPPEGKTKPSGSDDFDLQLPS